MVNTSHRRNLPCFVVTGNVFLTFHLLERIIRNEFNICRGLEQPPSCGGDGFLINCDPLGQWYPTIGISHKAGSPTTPKNRVALVICRWWFVRGWCLPTLAGDCHILWTGKPYLNKQCKGMTQVFEHSTIGIWKAHHGRRCPTKQICVHNISNLMSNFLTRRKIIINHAALFCG